MASKTKVNGLNHTAGIYSDMTVDGPEIGTLVIIVDRAKNLPNRKSIGKQDPYCAARLGKEAKKTETDRRGGQTPRWDQELRFTVHDSPDYYQLKVSVFNDDKKTDLIGETWVNLQEVVVPGGGQNDLWHNLNCKGKYAGEIRIEITYYDTRPKPEKPEKSRKGAAAGEVEESRESLKGPRQQNATPVKRRPLPSDPVTGATPIQVDTGPSRPHQPSSIVPDHAQTPPRGYPPQNQTQNAAPEPFHSLPRGYQAPSAVSQYSQTPPRGYQVPSAIPDHINTPTRGYQSPSYIPNQSPLQSVEYHTPIPRSPRASHSQSYGGSPNPDNFGSSPDFSAISPVVDRYEIHDQVPSKNHSQRNDFYEEEDLYDHDDQYDHHDDQYDHHSPYELPQPEDFGSPPSPGGPPPPPPIHRHNSRQVSPAPAFSSQGSYGFSKEPASSTVYDSPSPDMYRHSGPSPAHSTSYQSYSPIKDEQSRRPTNDTGYEQRPSRSNSYDPRYNTNFGSMQPTVEDEPSTPTNHGGYGSRSSQYDNRRYEQVPSPAPLNLSGRGSSASGRYAASIAPSTAPSTHNSNGYGSATSPTSFVPSMSSQTSYNSLPRQIEPSRKYSDDLPGDRMGEYGTPDSYGLPPVPPTLVAGMDPNIAQEISDRIYAEKRASFSQGSGNSSQAVKYNPQSTRPHPLSYHEAAQPFVPAASTYDERQSRIVTATTVPLSKPRSLSPLPARKSVSPAPETPDTRRLSGIPFGPDSYNVLNQVVGTAPSPSLSARYDTKEDLDAKIITYDGREIDPSDHIPESNYAPLLESKGPKYASQQPDRNYRSPQQNPVTGRTPLRVAQRPQSSAASSPLHTNSVSDYPPPSNGRNRLQKKSNRMSAQPVVNSSPLGPVSTYQDNSYSPTPRLHQRANTGDFSNENYSQQSYGSSPNYRGPSGPPPIPAKVPHGSYASQQQMNGADAHALLEEMRNIDLGSGRARRRGY